MKNKQIIKEASKFFLQEDWPSQIVRTVALGHSIQHDPRERLNLLENVLQASAVKHGITLAIEVRRLRKELRKSNRANERMSRALGLIAQHKGPVTYKQIECTWKFHPETPNTKAFYGTSCTSGFAITNPPGTITNGIPCPYCHKPIKTECDPPLTYESSTSSNNAPGENSVAEEASNIAHSQPGPPGWGDIHFMAPPGTTLPICHWKFHPSGGPERSEAYWVADCGLRCVSPGEALPAKPMFSTCPGCEGLVDIEDVVPHRHEERFCDWTFRDTTWRPGCRSRQLEYAYRHRVCPQCERPTRNAHTKA